jgi:hypothetical protein
MIPANRITVTAHEVAAALGATDSIFCRQLAEELSDPAIGDLIVRRYVQAAVNKSGLIVLGHAGGMDFVCTASDLYRALCPPEVTITTATYCPTSAARKEGENG